MERLYIRADASSQIGTGHFMRCLALGQAWKDAGGQVIFITACQSENLLRRLQEEDFDIHLLSGPYPDAVDWAYTNKVIAEHPDAWVVLDGYHFDEVYQQWVKEAGHPLLAIDGLAYLKHYYANIVLNQNLHSEQLHYSCEPYTRLLLGTKYVLLRIEFLAWKDWKREIPEIARRVLVTMGGSDPEKHTLKLIKALQMVGIPGLEVIVVIGITNPHAHMLKAAAKQSCISINLIQDARNMPELMAWADIAVSAAGSTVWELMFMGVPTILIAIADNQEPIARSVAEIGSAISVNDKSVNWVEIFAEKAQQLILDPMIRSKFYYHGRSLVDGLGTKRVIQALKISKPEEMY